MVVKLGRENTTLSSDSVTKDQGPYPSAETQETAVVCLLATKHACFYFFNLVIHALFSSDSLFSSCLSVLLILQPHNIAELENVEPLKDSEYNVGKRRRQVNYS